VARIAAENEETHEAWDGPLFDRFVRFRDLVVTGLAAHGETALGLHPPPAGGRVLDVGCGFGDASQTIAALVGPEGSVLGVDIAERFVEAAVDEAATAGVENVSFEVADVQVTEFSREFDYVFSRFGTMFFANPVPALRNLRNALVPGGRLCMVVWRRKLDNMWVHRAEQIVERWVERPEESDEPTCGPGPFSMANADTVTDQVLAAGFERVELRRSDIPMKVGDDLQHAIDLVTALGPAGEVMRLAGEEAEKLRPQVEDALREGLSDYVRDDGVYASASTWIVTAIAP
jgi:SAM-dependent methyltransferase